MAKLDKIKDDESNHKVRLREDEQAVNVDLNYLLNSFGKCICEII
jgi:hypothetical protein